jgi:hypothetical protein
VRSRCKGLLREELRCAIERFGVIEHPLEPLRARSPRRNFGKTLDRPSRTFVDRRGTRDGATVTDESMIEVRTSSSLVASSSGTHSTLATKTQTDCPGCKCQMLSARV